MKSLILIVAALLAFSGCTRIETGEVGLRIDMSKQVQQGELMPGSWNQTMIGDVLTFPVRDVAVTLDNKTPLTADNSALADFDATIIYAINPTAVSELWSKKSRAFHDHDDKSGDWILMHKFMNTVASNASYKAVRKYNALQASDNRKQIEDDIKAFMIETLKDEKLAESITITGVQVRSIQPAADIIASANAVVTAQNYLKTKTVEVETAKKEAERIAALNSNAKAIEYMQAQAQLKIAEGIAAGKVHTVVIPYDFKGMISVK